jgi:hypothetical protein
MSALGHKRTLAVQKRMSALPPKADMCSATRHVRYVPIADINQVYSITSSARPISVLGTLRPSALAVFRLMYSSTLVVCWTGRSAGFSPLITGQAIRFSKTASVTHQATGHDELAAFEDRRHGVADGQCGELFAPANEEWIAANHEPARSQFDQLCEDPIEVTVGAGIQDVELQAEGTSRCLHPLRVALGKSGIGWVDEQGYDALRGDELVQQLQPLRRYLNVRLSHARNVAVRPAKTGDEAAPDRIGARFKDYRNRRGRRLCCERRRSASRG